MEKAPVVLVAKLRKRGKESPGTQALRCNALEMHKRNRQVRTGQFYKGEMCGKEGGCSITGLPMSTFLFKYPRVTN